MSDTKKENLPAPKQNERTPIIFNYGEHAITEITINDEPWFVAKDICDALGIGNPTEALKALDDDEKMTSELLRADRGLTSETLRAGQVRKMNIINESGMYALIIRSNKPSARAFRKWVTSEVLPQIRKTGRYSLKDKMFGLAISRQALPDLNFDEKKLLLMLKQYLRVGDNKKVGEKLGVGAHHVSRIRRGVMRNERIMKALVEQAVENQKQGYGYNQNFLQLSFDLFTNEKGGAL